MPHFFNKKQSEDNIAYETNSEFVFNELHFFVIHEKRDIVGDISIKSDAVCNDEIHLKFIKIALPFVVPSITYYF